ncbi:MAG: DHH family phosphoesterase [Parcubacteria group bacterium]
MALTQYQQFYETIGKSNNPLIVFQKEASGDTIAASLALAALFKKLGQTVEIVSPKFELPAAFNFLNEAAQIKNKLTNAKKCRISLDATNLKNPNIEHELLDGKLHIYVMADEGEISAADCRIHDSIYKHDLIIALNTADLESLDELYEDNIDLFFQTPLINIDHSIENAHYGHLNIVNITASSASEIIYDLIDQIDSNLLDEKIATLLLTGMIDKTKSFRSPTITPKSLNIAGQLIAAGAERDAIIKNLYQTKSVNALKLWGHVLLNLKSENEGKIAWAGIDANDFAETNTASADLAGVIDELIISIPTVELTALFYAENGQSFCLVKSEKNHNLISHFAEYQPTGNKNFIKFKLNGSGQIIIDKLKQLVDLHIYV